MILFGGYKGGIINDDSWNNIAKRLKSSGKGNTNHHEEIEEEDLKHLYGQFDITTPTGLQEKVWFDLMFQLARRDRENMRAMTTETFRIGTDVQGKRFVYQFQEEVDKNHREADSSFDTSGEGRLYEVSGSILCPVRNFEEYLSRLHPSLNALWQRPPENVQDKVIWFCNVPLSERTLGNI